MKKYSKIIFLLAMVSLIAGCSVKSNATINEKKKEYDIESHHVVVNPGDLGKYFSETYYIYSHGYVYGDTSFAILNDELIVNDKKYGKLAPGDSVLVNHGKVFISGNARQGVAMTDKEIMDSSAVKESKKEIGGYLITVHPGNIWDMSNDLSGKHTYDVGRYHICISKDELSVNGKSYGKLNKGDSIEIDLSKVLISGKERQPIK